MTLVIDRHLVQLRRHGPREHRCQRVLHGGERQGACRLEEAGPDRAVGGRRPEIHAVLARGEIGLRRAREVERTRGQRRQTGRRGVVQLDQQQRVGERRIEHGVAQARELTERVELQPRRSELQDGAGIGGRIAGPPIRDTGVRRGGVVIAAGTRGEGDGNGDRESDESGDNNLRAHRADLCTRGGSRKVAGRPHGSFDSQADQGDAGDRAPLLKQRAAENLGIDLDEPLARERGLVGFVPIREGRPSLQSALLDEIDRLG